MAVFHEDILDHLYEEQKRVNEAINSVDMLIKQRDLFTPEAKKDLISKVRRSHPNCAICKEYRGASRDEAKRSEVTL